MESKAMNIFDSLRPATNGTASMKGASLSPELENSEFASLMGQSMQVQKGELIQALPNQEIMNFIIDGADDADNPILSFTGNDERIFTGMESKDLPAGVFRSNKFAQLTADTELPLFATEKKGIPLVNLSQAEDSEIIENLLQTKSEDKKQAITIKVDDSVKLSTPKTSLNPAQSELLPGLSDVDFQKDSHRQLNSILRDLNAKEVLINDKLQPEKAAPKSVVPLLGSDQLESLVRSNIKRASVDNRGSFSIVNESKQVSKETALPVSEENLINGETMKKHCLQLESISLTFGHFFQFL